jgi:MEDS: MEthanogen/methylotroph, DcmR Sensory domain
MNASTSTESQPIPFAGGILDRYRHVCAFFDSADEEQLVMAPFIREGLERGEKAVHIVDPKQRADYVRRLEDEGIPVGAAEARGQFDLHTWDGSFFRTGSFDRDDILTLIDDALKESTTRGFPGTRLVGHAAYPGEGRRGLDDWVEYESRVNYIVPEYRDPVICIYDASKFSGGVVMDILRIHPMVIIRGLLRENPFFVPPDQFLQEMHERAATTSGA